MGSHNTLMGAQGSGIHKVTFKKVHMEVGPVGWVVSESNERYEQMKASEQQCVYGSGAGPGFWTKGSPLPNTRCGSTYPQTDLPL